MTHDLILWMVLAVPLFLLLGLSYRWWRGQLPGWTMAAQWLGGDKAVLVAAQAQHLSEGIYRIRLQFAQPDGHPKEGVFTYTLSPPRTESFTVRLTVPEPWAERVAAGEKLLLSVQLRGDGNRLWSRDFGTAQLLKPLSSAVAEGALLLVDHPTVASLDLAELGWRAQKVDELRTAAKARLAKAAQRAPAEGETV